MITFLTILVYLLKIFEVVVVLTIILIGVDLVFFYYNDDEKKNERLKSHVRTQKENEAHEGFFEESYVRGFDPTGALSYKATRRPTPQALEYDRIMDELMYRLNNPEVHS